MRLNINSSEIVSFTNKLEKMHRKHLPKVVRDTLNNVALEGVKKKTLLSVSSSEFTTRQKNFFKANSRVDFAKGWNISKMKSEVGTFSDKLRAGSTNYAVRNLENQEEGGTIKGRSFIPLDGARTGSSWNRNVRSKYRIQNIHSKIIDAKKNPKGRTDEEKWILSAKFGGIGAFIIGTKRNSKGNRTLYEIKKIHKKSTGYSIGAHPIYSVRGNRSFSVKRTRFIEKSANLAGKDLNHIFVTKAKNELVRAR